MGITMFEGYSVGRIERGIPLPARGDKPLSAEQKHLLSLRDGESFVLALRLDGYATDNARRLARWARLRGIRTTQRRIDDESVRIWRVETLARAATDPPHP